MPLESLRQPFDPEQAGHKLREVQVEHEAQPESASKQLYEKLLHSPLYDSEGEAWYLGEGLNTQSVRDQLFGVMALAEFDKGAAQKKFEELKNSKFYENGSWHNVAMNMPVEGVSSFVTITGIAFEAYFNKEKGRELYENFLRDKGNNRGTSRRPEQEGFADVDISASEELLLVFIESLLDPEEAALYYQQLQATDLWDKEEGKWCSQAFPADGLSTESYYSADQLLGVLVELQLGISGWKKRYESLKKTSLFDADTQLWSYANFGSSLQNVTSESYKYTRPQLLSVIIEARLEKLAQQKLAAPTKLPEERNF